MRYKSRVSQLAREGYESARDQFNHWSNCYEINKQEHYLQWIEDQMHDMCFWINFFNLENNIK
jgi:hypothetical protein